MISIKHKFSVFLIVVVVFTTIAHLIYFISAENIRGYASATDAAGSLRMRSFRILNNLNRFSLAAPEEKKTVFKDIEKDEKEFDNILKGLYDKGPGIIKSANMDERALINNIINSWKTYKSDIERIIASSEPEALFNSESESLYNKTGDMVGLIDKLTKHIAAKGEYKVWFVQRMFIFSFIVAIIFLAFSLLYFTRRVVHPLQKASSFAARVGKGDLKARLRTTAKDEVGVLVNTLNNMVEKLERSHSELEKKVKKRTHTLSTIIRTTRNISRELGSKDLLPDVVKSAIELIGADAGTIALLDSEKGIIRYPYSYNMPEYIDKTSVPEGSGIAGKVMKTKMPVLLDDYPAHPQAVKSFINAGVKSLTAVPLVSGEKVLGALGVFRFSSSKKFSKSDIRVLSVVGIEAGIALQNSRLYEEVLRSKITWESTFDAITEGIVILDTDLRIVTGNRIFFEESGISAEKAVGMPYYEVFLNKQSIPSDSACLLALKNRRAFDKEYEHGDKTIRVKAFPLFDSKKRLIGVVAVLKDVTEERYMKARLLQAEKMVSVGELVSGVAHELNNPLTSVLGYSQLLLGKELDENIKRNLEKVASEAERASKIIQSLLVFARKSRPEKKSISINELIRKTLKLKEYELKVNNIDVMLNLDKDLPLTRLDAHQFQQVFINMLSNAEDALREGHIKNGRIDVSTTVSPSLFSKKDVIKIVFADNGPGIHPEMADRVFDPFFTTKEVGKGTGLGLSIAYGTVKEHNGEIYVKNRGSGGAEFVMEIPIYPVSKVVHGKRKVKVQDGLQREFKGKRVLTIDDEPYIVELIEEILGRDGHEVEKALTGEEGLRKLYGDIYDLIFLDIKMPGLDGMEVYNRIARERPELLKRLVFLTGDVVGMDTMSFLNKSGCSYIGKPFGMKEVRKIAMDVLQKGL